MLGMDNKSCTGSSTPTTQVAAKQRGVTMAEKHITDVTDGTFQLDVLESEQPVLVDFWATWCGPCKTLAPAVEEIAAEFDGRLKVMKLDVDQNGATASRFAIRGIPALLLFKGGKEVERIVGLVPKATISETVLKQMN
jgi:thioredoxin 1